MIGKTVSHFRILSQLGAGGMGVVYEAADTKLERTVALKFLPNHLTADPTAKARFVQEAKAASSLEHPAICSIFEIGESEDGQTFLVMPRYEGETLAERLAQGQLAIDEALEIFRQVARGLVKAHARGIVHRDIKPANIFLTNDDHAVILDFGLAKLSGQTKVTQDGTTLGTVTYMSPEQSHGEEVDGRSDIWSLGIVLYEMLAGRPAFRGEHPQAVIYSIQHEDPRPLAGSRPDAPPDLARFVDGCLKKVVAERFHDFDEVLAALDQVESLIQNSATSRRTATRISLSLGAESQPYPGLSAFTEEDAHRFFGREVEIEVTWQKILRNTMLAIIGPSGTGKSSFIRAGLIPAKPAAWGVAVCSPGSSPFLALRQALVPELAGDTAAVRELLIENSPEDTISAFRRWAELHEENLLVLDQFEELFTQNNSDTIEAFSDLLGRLRRDLGIRVLLSMRDDFLFHCHAYSMLAPVFDALVPLGPLTGSALQRALTEPARDLGFEFEEETLATEIMAEAEGERGSLPLLAFAMARLWEKRDLVKMVLTRTGYEEIGGVGGALAGHAERVMERVGTAGQGIVRELFRNLVTARGTRVSRTRDELLSVAAKGETAKVGKVLGELIAARLLTSYETKNDRSEAEQRVEIIHESLLSNWPRLVRWQTQDVDAAQVRDQVRHSAKLWEARNRSDDLLWSGTSFQEFRLWHDRYPGSLTARERAFTDAMLRKARRRRQRRAAALGSVFIILLAVLGIVGTLWRNSVKAEEKAVAETNRAEAGKLYQLAINQKDYPHQEYALNLAALELSDQPEYRRLMHRNLLRRPQVFQLPIAPDSHNPVTLDFSPDGKWLAVGWAMKGSLQLYNMNGGDPVLLEGHTLGRTWGASFRSDSRYLASTATDSSLCIWSPEKAELVHRVKFQGLVIPHWLADTSRIIVSERSTGDPVRWWSVAIATGEPELIGSAGPEIPNVGDLQLAALDAAGRWVVQPVGKEVRLYDFQDLAAGPKRILTGHDVGVMGSRFARDGRRFITWDHDGVVFLWSLDSLDDGPTRVFQSNERPIFCRITGDDDRLICSGVRGLRIWDLKQPPVALPLEITTSNWMFDGELDPSGKWVVTLGTNGRVGAWPLVHSYPQTVVLDEPGFVNMEFSPDGRWVVTSRDDGALVAWPFENGITGKPRVLFQADGYNLGQFQYDESGRHVFASVGNSREGDGSLQIIAMDGSGHRSIVGCNMEFVVDPTGRFVASSDHEGPKTHQVHIIDTEADTRWVLDSPDDGPSNAVGFLRDGRLVAYGKPGLGIWDIQTGFMERLGDCPSWAFLCPDRETILVKDEEGCLWRSEIGEPKTEKVWDNFTFQTFTTPSSDQHGTRMVISGYRGVINVLDFTTGRLHPLPLFESSYCFGVLDREGRWIATSGDGVIKVLPMPQGEDLKSLPYEEFMAKIRSLSNIRAHPDENAESGYRIYGEGMPDWSNPPTW